MKKTPPKPKTAKTEKGDFSLFYKPDGKDLSSYEESLRTYLKDMGATGDECNVGLAEIPAFPDAPLHLGGDDAEKSWNTYATALRELTLLRNGPKGRTLDDKIKEVMSLHPALQALSQARTRVAWREATSQISKCPIVAQAWRSLQDAAQDENEGFAAGWHLATAFFLLTVGAPARHGKLMNPKKAGAKKPRDRDDNPLREAVLNAWEDYRQDHGEEGSKLNFAEEWLRKNCDIYDIKYDDTDGCYRLERYKAKPDTVRRWIK